MIVLVLAHVSGKDFLDYKDRHLLCQLAASYFLERLWYKEGLSEQTIEYEKIENIKPERRAILIADLKERTGLDIRSAEILTTDFLRDMARVRVYYKASAQSNDDDSAMDDDDDD